MYVMSDKIRQKTNKKKVALSAKDCAYIAVFVAITIVLQLAFSALPGVELVTLLFVSFSFAFGVRRGMIAATTFSLLRQIVFGVFPSVLILYLLYFNLLTCVFGGLGKLVQASRKSLLILTLIACVCTVGFTFFDIMLTVFWYAYTPRAAQAYFYASLPFMIPQIICVAVSMVVLFLPLVQVFRWIKRA